MRETVLRKASPLAWVLFVGCNVGSQQGYEPAQPIAYSHAIHAGEYQMQCLYCHSGAEKSRHAGVPAVNVCMNCHTQVTKVGGVDSQEIKKVVNAADAGVAIAWTKVHRLPDFVYFNHSRHVNAGVVCQTCHGPVQTMVRVKQVETMSMGWCLACHRTMAAAPENAGQGSGKLVPPTDCAACHY